jgi:hypothetical protein
MFFMFRDKNTPLTETQKLLRKDTLYHIELFPNQFNMQHWDSSEYNASQLNENDLCTTVRCIAGWALFLAGKPVGHPESDIVVQNRAIECLGLTEDEYRTNHGELFYIFDAEVAVREFRELVGKTE